MRFSRLIAPAALVAALAASPALALPTCSDDITITELPGRTPPPEVMRSAERLHGCTPRVLTGSVTNIQAALDPSVMPPETSEYDQQKGQAEGLGMWLLLSLAVFAAHFASGRWAQSEKHRAALFEKRKARFNYDPDAGEYRPITNRGVIKGSILVSGLSRSKRLIQEHQYWKKRLMVSLLLYPIGVGAWMLSHNELVSNPSATWGAGFIWWFFVPIGLGVPLAYHLLYITGFQKVSGALVIDPPAREWQSQAYGPDTISGTPRPQTDLAYRPTEGAPEPAPDQSNPYAMIDALYHGRGIAMDRAEAQRLMEAEADEFRESAEGGDAEAQYLLAITMDEYPEEYRPEEVRKWMEAASASGHKDAAKWLEDKRSGNAPVSPLGYKPNA